MKVKDISNRSIFVHTDTNAYICITLHRIYIRPGGAFRFRPLHQMGQSNLSQPINQPSVSGLTKNPYQVSFSSLMMMMIAFITFKSSLVPLFEGL